MTNKSSKNVKAKIEKMDFESAMERLEEIVDTLSSEKINLDSMVELYEEGTALKQHCEKRLKESEMRIEVISKNKELSQFKEE